jgi:hypothetical protein
MINKFAVYKPAGFAFLQCKKQMSFTQAQPVKFKTSLDPRSFLEGQRDDMERGTDRTLNSTPTYWNTAPPALHRNIIIVQQHSKKQQLCMNMWPFPSFLQSPNSGNYKPRADRMWTIQIFVGPTTVKLM